MRNVAFTRWDPLRDLLALHEQLGQLVGTDAPGWTPPVDLYETADEFVLTAELPGLTRDQIDIHAEESRIVDPRRARRDARPRDAVRAVSPRRARPRPLLARVRAAGADRRRRRHRRSEGRRADGHDPEGRATAARGASTSADRPRSYARGVCAFARARRRRLRRRPGRHRPHAHGRRLERRRTAPPRRRSRSTPSSAARRRRRAAAPPRSPAAARTSRASPARR